MRSLPWIALGAFAAGALSGLTSNGFRLGVTCALGGAMGLLVRRRPIVTFAAAAALAFGLGSVGATARQPGRALVALGEHSPRCVVHGSVLEHPTSFTSLVSVDSITCGPRVLRDAGAVAVRRVELDPGTQVRLVGWLLPSNDDERALLRRLAAAASFQVDETEITSPPRGLHAASARFRQELRESLSELDPHPAALLLGLTIGETQQIDAQTIEQFRASGLSHVLAVSGSNVAIVLTAISFLIQPLSLRVRVALAFGGLAWFVMVVGPEPSVLRAAAMGGIGLLALASSTSVDPLRALPLALIGLIAFRPSIVTSLGLHLSAAATAGICLWARPIMRRCRRLPAPLRTLLAASLAAQFAVAPLIALAFGSLSVTAPVANLLALPAVAPATVLGLAAGGLETLGHPSGASTAAAAGPFAGWVLGVGRRLGEPGWASVQVAPWIAWAIALTVATTAVVTIALRR